MELNSQDLSCIVSQHTHVPENRGFIIHLGGHQFVNSRGKKVFAKRAHAMLSLRATIEYTIKCLVRKHLDELGVNSDEIYRNEDYICAWENFVKQATESGFLQIIELK